MPERKDYTPAEMTSSGLVYNVAVVVFNFLTKKSISYLSNELKKYFLNELNVKARTKTILDRKIHLSVARRG